MEYPGVATGIMIQNEKGEVLMGLRKKENLWSFPGGKTDMFESIEGCVKRETFEECGLIVEKLDFLCLSNDMVDSKHFLTVGFKTNNWKGEVVNKELNNFERWEWFPFDQLPENIFLASKNMVENLKENRVFYDRK